MEQKRITEIQQSLKQQKLDAAVFALSEDVLLIAQGYWSRNGLAFAVVPAEGTPALLVPKPEREDVPEDVGMPVYEFGSVDLAEGNAYENITAQLKQIAKAGNFAAAGRIGLELSIQNAAPSQCDGEVILPGAATQAAVRAAFPEAELVDILPLVFKSRKIKYASDIERIERVNRLAYAGLAEFARFLDEGKDCTEIQLAVMVESFIALHAQQYGVKYARAWAQVTSGPRTEGAWNSGVVTTNRSIADGEPVLIEMGTVADGYFCDLTLTHFKKEASGEIKKIYDVVVNAQKAALAAVRPGVSGREVDAAARKVVEEAGYGRYFNHGTGHGTGFAYHDGAPALNPSSTDVLEVGNIHSCEPGIYVPGVGGVRLEVNSLVTENGSRVLGK